MDDSPARAKLLVLPHMGVGDMLVLRGMVAALSDDYDVAVVCLQKIRDNVLCLFEDLGGRVSLALVNSASDICPRFGSDGALLAQMQSKGYRVLAIGEQAWERLTPWAEDNPHWIRCLYEDVRMDPALKRTRFRLPRSREPHAAAMLAKVRELAGGKSYVIVHDDALRPLVVPEIDEDVLVFHVDDKRFSSTVVFDYVEVIRHARHFHAIDSCFALLADLAELGTPTTVHAYSKNGTDLSATYENSNVLYAPPTPARYGAHRLSWLSSDDDFGRALRAHFHHFAALQDIMRPTREVWRPCGSYLMGPDSMDYDPSMHPKQALLFQSAKGKTNALEVGVHGGHSLLMILLASPAAHVTCVDICAWEHTARCVAYLQAQFPGRITLLGGSSREVLPLVQDTFDFVHIDGDHSYEGAKLDMEHAHRLSAPDTTFIFDDYSQHIARAVADLSHLFEVVECPACAWTNCLARRKA